MKIVKSTATVVMLLAALPASAAYVTLDDVGRGWYMDQGYTEGLTNPNYGAGECTRDPCGLFDYAEYRNYFIFELGSIDRVITSATLWLWLPEDGFVSPTGSETYGLFDVDTAPDLLGRHSDVGIFDDFGTGRSYGTYIVTETDEHTLIQIQLNAVALADLNTTAGLFAFGGAVTTLDAEMNNELIFGYSDNQHARLLLELTPVPVPGAAWLLASALLALRLGRSRSWGGEGACS
jgi:hypothetical protein